MAALELRPMGIGDILDATFRLYRMRFLTFLTITLLAYIPYGIVIGLFQASFGITQQSPFGSARPGGVPARVVGIDENVFLAVAQASPGRQFDPQPPVQFGNFNAIIGSVIGMALFVLVVLPLCQGALVHNISASYLGEHLSAGASYGRAAPRLVRMLLASLLVGITVSFGCILLVVPGIIFMFLFSLVAPVVMLEDQGVIGCLKRSRELMRGNIGKAFMLFLVVGILAAIFSVVMSIVLAMVPWPHPFLPGFFNAVLPAVILPIQLAPTILLYYDIRIRKEAFDLQQLASQLGQPALV